MTTDNKGAMKGEHCINCGLKVDPKCACSRGRALLVAQPAQAVGKQPVAYLVTDPADDQISHIVRTQEFADKLKADGYTIEALVIDPVPAEGATPEGCTTADAKMLRKANHGLADEITQYRNVLGALLHQVDDFVSAYGEADFFTGDARRLLDGIVAAPEPIPVPADDAWWTGEEDADGNPLTTIRVDELSALRDQPDALSALAELVELKDMKDQRGKIPEYCRRQPAAWDRAREILARVQGTFACPICGKESPHQHTDEEIAKHRGATDAPEPIHASDAKSPDLSELVSHLRGEADFNRSWTDGRRGGPADPSEGYVVRRLELAARSDAWADGVESLIRVAPAVDALPVHAVAPDLPLMRNAFRVTEVTGDPDPSKQRFRMRFSFRNIEDLHAAEAEWDAFAQKVAPTATKGEA